MKADSIELICNDLLAACAQAYTEMAYAPKVPERRFVTHGQAVAVGEQLTVSCAGVKLGKPFPLPQISQVETVAIPQADFVIEIWRAGWPPPEMSSASKSLPDPSSVADAAITLSRDAATLFAYISNLSALGGLLPSIPEIETSARMSLQPMVPLGPVGQLAGWRWPMSVKLAIL